MARIATAGPNTTVLTIAASAAATHDPGLTDPAIYRVASTRVFHVLVTRAGTAADVNDMIVPNGCEFIRVNAGEQISVIQATGEADGSVWLTPQREEG
jgi:hypothetical protein